jgi:Transmembrane secretion effector
VGTFVDPEADRSEDSEQARDEPRGRMGAFRALRHRNYRLYFVGQLTSLAGTWMQSAAQAWLVLGLTNSSLMLGVVSFAQFLPFCWWDCSPASWSIESIAAACCSERRRC